MSDAATSAPGWLPGFETFARLWEHMFVTSEGHTYARFQRALERGALWAAEDAAREMAQLSLQDALRLVHLYADRGSPKFEAAARRWLCRYLEEASPRLVDFAEVAANLARRSEE